MATNGSGTGVRKIWSFEKHRELGELGWKVRCAMCPFAIEHVRPIAVENHWETTTKPPLDYSSANQQKNHEKAK